jgi:protein-S-isoprenylcysteine O-methyltransferase Ste14
VRYVVAQFALLAGIAVAWVFPPRPHHWLVGLALALPGALLFAWAARALGPALTPSPEPRGPLVTGGPYRYLRHPMYLGGTLLFAGVSLALSWLGLALTAALALLWVAKARLENRYLAERFPDGRRGAG